MKAPLTKYAVSFTRVMLQCCHNEGQDSIACRIFLPLRFKSVGRLFTRFFQLAIGLETEF